MPLFKNSPANRSRQAARASEKVISHGLVLRHSAALINASVCECVVDELMSAYVREKPSFLGLASATDFRNFLESVLYGEAENVRPVETEAESKQPIS